MGILNQDEEDSSTVCIKFDTIAEYFHAHINTHTHTHITYV